MWSVKMMLHLEQFHMSSEIWPKSFALFAELITPNAIHHHPPPPWRRIINSVRLYFCGYVHWIRPDMCSVSKIKILNTKHSLLLTPWSTVFLEKLVVTRLVKKLPAFYGTPYVYFCIIYFQTRCVFVQANWLKTFFIQFLVIHYKHAFRCVPSPMQCQMCF